MVTVQVAGVNSGKGEKWGILDHFCACVLSMYLWVNGPSFIVGAGFV